MYCAVSKTKVPVLIIHGDNDTQAPVSMAYRIYNSCKSEKQLYIVSGAEHKNCYKSNLEKYESIVSEFIVVRPHEIFCITSYFEALMLNTKRVSPR